VKNQDKETPPMKFMAKVVVVLIVLVVVLPALARYLHELLLPFVVIALVLLVARVVWFHTRL
jgi:hypothetical protein